MYTDPYVTSRSYYEGLSFSGTIDTFPGTTTPAIKAPTSIDTGVHATAMLDFSTLFSSVKTFPDDLEGVNFSFTCNMGCGQYVSFALDERQLAMERIRFRIALRGQTGKFLYALLLRATILVMNDDFFLPAIAQLRDDRCCRRCIDDRDILAEQRIDER